MCHLTHYMSISKTVIFFVEFYFLCSVLLFVKETEARPNLFHSNSSCDHLRVPKGCLILSKCCKIEKYVFGRFNEKQLHKTL